MINKLYPGKWIFKTCLTYVKLLLANFILSNKKDCHRSDSLFYIDQLETT